MQLSLFACAVLVLAGNAEKAKYHGYKVYRVTPITEEQFSVIRNIEHYFDGASFWKESGEVRKYTDIMVAPQKIHDFNGLISQHNIKNETLFEDVQQLIDNERPLVPYNTTFGWNDYYPLDQIYAWLDSLVSKYPGVVSTIVGGITYEGRQIKGVKVSFKKGNPGVFIEGGIHAREWISPATVTYILNRLLSSQDSAVRELAQSFDYYVFPVFNPDGYVYSHNADRLWRKTRRPTDNGCYGVDANRNWDFHWMEVGASSDPCSDIYAGPSAFSEIETKSISQYINSVVDKFDVYLDFHSFGQFLMFPYGHSDEQVPNHQELMSLAKQAVAALAENNGTIYEYGNTYSVVGQSGGSSMDWVRGVHNKSYTFSWELRNKESFILPPSQIIETAEETFNSVVVILQHAKRNLRRN